MNRQVVTRQKVTKQIVTRQIVTRQNVAGPLCTESTCTDAESCENVDEIKKCQVFPDHLKKTKFLKN